MKVWSGTAWAEKPAKVWSGTAWVQKPTKVWSGSAWVAYPAVGGAWGPDESLYPPAAATEGQAPSVLSLGSRIGILSNGRITHIRYWRASGMLPSRTVMIWSDAAALLFSTSTTGVAGWNLVPVSPPLDVTAGQTIRVAYGYAGSAADGNFGFIVSSAVYADTANLDFISGCYHPGGSADFPDTIPGDASNYYADIVYQKKIAEPTYEANEILYGAYGGPSLPSDPNSFSVGSRMTVLAKGRVTHFRYFRPSGSLASRYVAIWSDTGTLLADATTSGDITGWNEWPLTTPLLVNAGTILRSAHGYSGNATDGGFPFDMGGVTPSGANLRFEGGVYSDTRPAGGGGELIYPANAILPNHYFGDVVFQKETGALVRDIPPLVELTPLPSQPEPPGGLH